MSVTEVATAGKYLTFSLADEFYGLEILRVQEIVGMMPVTRVPRLPDYVAGVVNLRGRIIPLLDLRRTFGLAEAPITDRTCIIVVSIVREGVGNTVIGIIVDGVSEVVDLTDDFIEETPVFGSDVDTSFIKGVGRFAEHVVLLLDIDTVLTSGELAAAVNAARHVVDGDQDAAE